MHLISVLIIGMAILEEDDYVLVVFYTHSRQETSNELIFAVGATKDRKSHNYLDNIAKL